MRSIAFRHGTFQPTRKSYPLDKGHVRNGECGKPHKDNLHDTRVQRGPGQKVPRRSGGNENPAHRE